jgi:hypothetical protein
MVGPTNIKNWLLWFIFLCVDILTRKPITFIRTTLTIRPTSIPTFLTVGTIKWFLKKQLKYLKAMVIRKNTRSLIRII